MEIFEAKEVTDDIVEAFQRLIPQLSSSSMKPSKKELQEIANSSEVILLLAIDEGRIVGTISLVVVRLPTGMRAWIEDAVVDEPSRGKGIGTSLILEALKRAKKKGAKTVDLTSQPVREAANRLYKQIGFQPRQTNIYRYLVSQ